MDSKLLEQSGVDLSDPDALYNWMCDNVWDADKGDDSALAGDSEEAATTV